MIDTAKKRRSAAGLSVGWGITPNADKDKQWRYEVAWNYSGVAQDEAACLTISEQIAFDVLLADMALFTVELSDSPVTDVLVEDEAC